MMTVSGLHWSAKCYYRGIEICDQCFSPAVKIGFSSDMYEVTESTGYVNVQVVKNGSSDEPIIVLFNTTAGTALGIYPLHSYREE